MTFEMRRHNKVLVKNKLFDGNSPSASNCSSTAKLADIRNQMYKATIKYQLSPIDQENSASKVEACTSANKGDKIFFRPRLYEEPDEADTQQNEVINNGNDDRKEEPVYLTTHTKPVMMARRCSLSIKMPGRGDSFKDMVTKQRVTPFLRFSR